MAKRREEVLYRSNVNFLYDQLEEIKEIGFDATGAFRLYRDRPTSIAIEYEIKFWCGHKWYYSAFYLKNRKNNTMCSTCSDSANHYVNSGKWRKRYCKPLEYYRSFYPDYIKVIDAKPRVCGPDKNRKVMYVKIICACNRELWQCFSSVRKNIREGKPAPLCQSCGNMKRAYGDFIQIAAINNRLTKELKNA